MIISCEGCGLQYDVRAYPEGTKVQCRCRKFLTVPAHQITTIRCPSCGGTVDASSQRCSFCQSMITRKNCPQCASPLRENAKFCDQCGATMRTVSLETAKASELNCPRCKVPMLEQSCAGYPVAACGECLGMWIGHDVLELIYKDAPRQLQPVLGPQKKTDSLRSPAGKAPRAQAAYIPCPSCNSLMNPRNYARRSGVIIDVCKEHGVWFDAGELNQILDFHAKGGDSGPDPLLEEKAKARAELNKLRVESIADQRAQSTAGMLHCRPRSSNSTALFAGAIASLWLD